ncbi:MAG: transglycosylase SLT domain-containing protein, partial [bacterium]
TFLGDEARGNWQLKVEDRAGADIGSLNLWKIKVIPDSGEQWTTVNYICESFHPYSNNYTNTWVINHPGASKMKVHFEKIDLEPRYDYLYIMDKNNQIIATYNSYNLLDVWSPIVSGDTIKVKLTTDYSVIAYGFKVDKYQAVSGSPPPQDTTPPAQITNLSCSEITQSSLKLTWTSPGDDGNTGQATGYDIRYSTSQISEANWQNATSVQNKPFPAIAGTQQSFVVLNLNLNTLYYFAIKTYDERGNTSALSNIAQGQTQGPIDISIGSQTQGSISNRQSLWYWLYLPQETQVRIRLTMDSHIDYDLFVYSGDQSSAGPLIAQSTYGRGRPDECTLTRSGYLWIKVFNYSSSGSGNYSLEIEGIKVLLGLTQQLSALPHPNNTNLLIIASGTVAGAVNATWQVGDDFPDRVIGRIEGNGLFRAIGTGSCQVRASYGNRNGLTTITVIRPARLGNTNNQYDVLIINAANANGIPPQLLKAQIHQESGANFNPNAYRYEPDYDYLYISGPGNNDLFENPYFHYRVGGKRVDGTTFPSGDRLPSNYLEITRVNSSPDVNVENTNPNDGFGLSAWELVDNNPRQKWKRPPNNFTAQLVIAASYGLLQVMYPTAVDSEYEGEPYGLFNPQTIIGFGSGYLRSQWRDTGNWMEDWNGALARYNAGPNVQQNPDGTWPNQNYINAVRAYERGYMPQE